jgi:multidrug resistance protein, MATE family
MSILSQVKDTHHPNGSVRELFIFSFPLILTCLSQSAMLFSNRFLLSRHSLHTLAVCAAAQALCILFQLPCIRIASIGQVFVGQHSGAGRFSMIGPAIWQVIWFSMLSMLIVIPLGYGLQSFFFANSPVPDGIPYFKLLLWANFLFPLSYALISFYLGIGQSKMVIYSQLLTHGIHILLDYCLIFGIQGLVPPLGFMGAAYATIFAQLFNCAILLVFFLKSANKEKYATHDYRFKKEPFFETLRIGLPKALARFCVLAVWTCNMHLMMKRGESHLAIVAFGSTLVGTFIFITEGMSQGLITIASRLIGAQRWVEVWKLYRSAFLFSMGTISLLSIPLIFYSDITISLFFKSSQTAVSRTLLVKTCQCIWILFIGNAINFIGTSFLTASKDTAFHMLANLLSWVVCFLPILICIGHFNYSADFFWIVYAIEPIAISCLLHLRLRQERWKNPSLI